MSIAYLLGPLLGGLLSDKTLLESLTISTPFYFICVLFLCLAGLSALVLDKSVVSPTAVVRTFWQRINFIQRMSALFSNKQLKTFLLISTAFTLAVDIFYEFGPVYLTVKWTLGPAQLIFYNAALCIGLAIGNGWLSAYLSSRVSTRLAILCSIGGFCLFLIGTVLVNSPWQMLLCFALCGVVIALAVTLLTVKISNTAADTIQGEVLGVQLSLRVFGDAIICLFGSALLLLSPKLILIVASAMTSAVLIYYGTRKKKA